MVNEIGVYGPSECEDFCRNLPDCTWFTYYSDLELCTALTECVLLSGSVGNSISGQIKCLGEPQCNINGRCTGVLLGVSNIETPEDCQIVCQNDPKCKWYTHDSSNKGCFTFEDCAAINEDCGTCVSGEFNCRIEGEF